jgi:hypothetical protein
MLVLTISVLAYYCTKDKSKNDLFYVGENAEFERQMLSGELDVELIPKELWQNVVVLLKQEFLLFYSCWLCGTGRWKRSKRI